MGQGYFNYFFGEIETTNKEQGLFYFFIVSLVLKLSELEWEAIRPQDQKTMLNKLLPESVSIRNLTFDAISYRFYSLVSDKFRQSLDQHAHLLDPHHREQGQLSDAFVIDKKYYKRVQTIKTGALPPVRPDLKQSMLDAIGDTSNAFYQAIQAQSQKSKPKRR